MTDFVMIIIDYHYGFINCDCDWQCVCVYAVMVKTRCRLRQHVVACWCCPTIPGQLCLSMYLQCWESPFYNHCLGLIECHFEYLAEYQIYFRVIGQSRTVATNSMLIRCLNHGQQTDSFTVLLCFSCCNTLKQSAVILHAT